MSGYAYNKDFKNDSQEKIRRCLSCERARCNNCLDYKRAAKVRRRLPGILESIEYRELSDIEYKLVYNYPSVNNDDELGRIVGLSRTAVAKMRRELGLPSVIIYSPADRRRMVEPWMR